MNDNIEVLNFIYQNAEMSKDVIERILKEIKYLEFSNILEEQLKNYQVVLDKGDIILNDEARGPKGIDSMPQTMAYFELRVITLKDDSHAEIAKRIINGSTQIILDITTNLNKYNHINNDTKDLARRLIKIEQDNIELLEPFLK